MSGSSPPPPGEKGFVGFSAASVSAVAKKTALASPLPTPIIQKNPSAKIVKEDIVSSNNNQTDFKTILEGILKEDDPIKLFQKLLDILLSQSNDLAKFKENLYVFLNATKVFKDFYTSTDLAFKDFKHFVNANISNFVIENNLRRLSLDNLVVFIAMLNEIHPEAKTIHEISNVPEILSVLEQKLRDRVGQSREESLNQRYLEWLTILENKTSDLTILMKATRKDPISVAILEFIIKNKDLSEKDKADLIETLKQQVQPPPAPALSSAPPKAPLKK
ncbi:MAG: hypothetical protein ABSA84_05715 [Gammaproteobacteria bacterium]